MQTKALPDVTPGDVSDAETNVFSDSELQSTDDWTRIQGQIESGELEAAIQAEEAQIRRSRQTEAPQRNQRYQEEMSPEDEDDAADEAQARRLNQLPDDEDNGSDPPMIGLFGELQADPRTGAKPEKQPTEQAFTGLQDLQEEQSFYEEQPAEPAPKQQSGGGKAPQYRIRGANDVENLALDLRKKADMAGKPLSLKDALRLAEETLGSTAAEPEAETPSQFGEFQTPEEVEARIEQLEDEMDAAIQSMNLEELPDKRQEIRRLRKVIPQIQEQANLQREAYTEAYNSSYAKAAALYPGATDKNSEFFKAMQEMDTALRDTNDRRFHDPNKPMMLARAVAERMGILPNVSIGKTPRVQSASGTSPRAKFQAAPPVPVSAGGGRSGSAPALSLPETESDYYSLKESFQH